MRIIKNKVLLIVLAVLICIPTVVAVVYYSLNKGGTISPDAASTLTIKDSEGGEYVFEKGASEEADTLIGIFNKMEKNAEERGALPDAVSSSPGLTVIYSTGARETRYQYYLTRGADNAYYLDTTGKAFQILAEDAEEFLATPYAASIYNESKIPALMLSGEHKVAPSAAEWMYKNSSGNFVAADVSSIIAKEEASYELDGGLSLEYSVEPDNTLVVITDDAGETIFNDSYANIGSLHITAGTNVHVSVEAKWFEDEEKTYYGSLTHTFKAVVSEVAEFYPGVTSATVGEFVSITALNVKNPAKIQFTSEPPIEYEPKFVTDEANPEYVRALVPFKTTLTPGNYVFTLSYAGTTQQINFTLNDRTFNTKEYDIDEATAASFYTEESRTSFESDTAEAASLVSGRKLWDGYFLQGENLSGGITFGFGHTRTISSLGESYVHPGVDYSATAGESVQAINDGKVVYAGVLELTGYTVVVDHGFGLKSWYWHLSENTVKEGDTVKRGDEIGKTGNTGFTNQKGAHIGMSVCDVFVCPYATWSDGEWRDVPLYTK